MSNIIPKSRTLDKDDNTVNCGMNDLALKMSRPLCTTLLHIQRVA